MAFPEGVRRLIVHGVATRRGAASRCTSTGTVIGARSRVRSRLGRVVDLLLLVSLLATEVVTGWSAGGWAGDRADWWSWCLEAC